MAQPASATPRPNMTPEAIISRLRLDSVTFVSELARSHGDIVELPLGKQSLFLLNSPAYIREIFTRSDIFKKRPDEAAENSYLGQIGGFSPMFGPSLLSGYSTAMIEASERANTRWQNALAANGSLNVDIYREMMRVTLEIVVQTLFQMDVQDQSADLVEAILQLDTGYGFDPLTANLGHLLPAGPERGRSESDAAARARVQAAMQRLFDAAKTMPEPPPLIATLIKYVGEQRRRRRGGDDAGDARGRRHHRDLGVVFPLAIPGRRNRIARRVGAGARRPPADLRGRPQARLDRPGAARSAPAVPVGLDGPPLRPRRHDF